MTRSFRFFTSICLFLFTFNSFAGLVEDFEKVNSQRKGPFSLNYLQGTRSRVVVDGGAPSGKFLFQAAYRNDLARGLVSNYNLYIANLFTTNYYELMGEYVYADAYGSHDVAHEALLAVADVAMPKATVMTRNWVLEKYYLIKNHNSKLTNSFQIRGISGSEFEQAYAVHFFNFFAAGLSKVDELEFLPAYLLLKESPVNDSNSLAKARQLILDSYDSFAARWGKNDQRVRDLYELRNAIHNQLSKEVINQIDRYVARYPFYKKEGHTYLFTIRKILVEYYDFRAEKISVLAKQIGLRNIEALAAMAEAGDPAVLQELSQAVAELRRDLSTTDSVVWNKKAQAMLLISYTAQYLSKEINQAPALNGDLLQVMVNLAYMEGFLLQDNWQYFLEESVAAATDTSKTKELIANVIEISLDSINSTFKNEFTQWNQLSEDLANFYDDVAKSSSLNALSVWADKL